MEKKMEAIEAAVVLWVFGFWAWEREDGLQGQ